MFDLHGTDWTTAAIYQLGDVIFDFPDVFSRSKTDSSSCSLMPFVISVPEISAPVTSRPHRINPIMAKDVDISATIGGALLCPIFLVDESHSPV